MRFNLLLPALGFLTLCAAAQREGSISGAVFDHDGVPVAGAHVSAEVMRDDKILTVLTANTNDRGRFLFSHLKLGEYHVSAEKQEAGYLFTAPDIFTCKPPVTIVLSEESRTANTSVRFMAKKGHDLRMGERRQHGGGNFRAPQSCSGFRVRMVNHRDNR